jgi:hypothetical protein
LVVVLQKIAWQIGDMICDLPEADKVAGSKRVLGLMPEILTEDGAIQANPDRIREVAEDAEALIRIIVDEHEHGWLMLLHDFLSQH